MANKKKIILISVIALFWFFRPAFVSAQYDGVNNAFIVSPAKQEITLNPGESVIRNVYITNKLGFDSDFQINVEDISGGADQSEIIKYYGQNLGPYSIRNYVVVNSDRVRVSAGETKVVPVMITLPNSQKPGGLYGGIFVTAVTQTGQAGMNVSTRIGSLIFLRVKGNVLEQSEIKKFGTFSGQSIFGNNSPLDFVVSVANTGNVYLNPYGMIEIKDYRGRVIDRLPIEPWFVFPDSVRSRSLTWKNPPLAGFFTATLYLNHGYTLPHATVLSVHFVIIPVWIIVSILLGLIILFIVYKLRRRIKKWQI